MWRGTEAEYGRAIRSLVLGKEKHRPKMPPSKIALTKRRAELPLDILYMTPIQSNSSVQKATGFSHASISAAIARLIRGGYMKRSNGVQPASYDITEKGREKLAGVVHNKLGRPPDGRT